jgi:NAD(P)-dependent dehydrogenase (short-subunit alcohol dehydrogenase family)
VLLARGAAALGHVVAAIRGADGDAQGLVRDLSSLGARSGLTGEIKALMGRLGILVLNAGILGELAPLHMYNDAAWDEVMTVNLTSNAFFWSPPARRGCRSISGRPTPPARPGWKR